tara:strand:+ start:340 stop:1458 length:1119 start_codon:yes stop_codon:yes gene_type:complete
MKKQFKHKLLPAETHDELARENYSVELSQLISSGIFPSTQKILNTIVSKYDLPKEKKQRISYLRKKLLSNSLYKYWSSLKRTSQEILFDTVSEIVFIQSEKLNSTAERINKKNKNFAIKTNFAIPNYISAVDIHCMPGGYTCQNIKNDIYSGSLYDRSLHLYSRGALGPYNDDIGNSVCIWLKKRYCDFFPKTILDLGCSTGNNTLPYKKYFPNAIVFGIDISEPLIRYANARANLLNYKEIYFSQQNAESTNFKSDTFDLLVSHLLGHETSLKALKKIICESYKLLNNGGKMLHIETDWETKKNMFNMSVLDWETHFNAEPFKTTMECLDKKNLALEAGFKEKNIFECIISSKNTNGKYIKGKWKVFGAVK